LREIKEKISRCLSKDPNNSKADNIRLWKCSYNYNSREKLSDYFVKHKLSADEISIDSSDQDGDIQENSGVSFPGQQFDMYLDKEFKELDRT
jgi:hypothetical protein